MSAEVIDLAGIVVSDDDLKQGIASTGIGDSEVKNLLVFRYGVQVALELPKSKRRAFLGDLEYQAEQNKRWSKP